MLKWLIHKLHRHTWEGTHVNKWQHYTRERCNCGMIREFQYPRPDLPIDVAMDRKIVVRGMPWDQGMWVWSNGKVSAYRAKTTG